MRATHAASSCRAGRTRVTNSPMREGYCRDGAIGKRCPQRIDPGQPEPIRRGRSPTSHVAAQHNRIVAGTRRTGKCVRLFGIEEKRVTLASTMSDLPAGDVVGISKTCRENGVGGEGVARSIARGAWMHVRSGQNGNKHMS